jgi:type I site-specific restriction-modification system R (restriction) subunit
MALSVAGAEEDEETTEDAINRIMEARKLLPNASYFAFTATPKNKTLEIFGEPAADGGKVRHRPFHGYTMKQAIDEGFILDVLKSYTPVASYYRLVKTIESDPEFDTKRAKKKLRYYVESNDHAIRLKAEIMVDHFHEQVLALNKIGGQARAMVVTSGIERAIQYFHAMCAYLRERKSPHQAQAAQKIQLPDADGEIGPVPADGGGRKPEPGLDRLSNILKTFNDQFGNITWEDADRVRQLITEEIPQKVAADTAYQNAKKNSDKQNARIEHDKALARVIVAVMKDDTELFKQYSDNPDFKRWLADTVFGMTYEQPPAR